MIGKVPWMNRTDNEVAAGSGLSNLAETDHNRGSEAVAPQGQHIDQYEEQLEAESADIKRKMELWKQHKDELRQLEESIKRSAQEVEQRRIAIENDKKRLADEAKRKEALQNKPLNAREQRALDKQANREATSVATFQVAPLNPLLEHDNRRTYQRIRAEVEVSIFTEHNFYAGISENISEGGIFISTFQQIPLGTLLDIQISLLEEDPITVKGEVCWIRDYNDMHQEISPGVGVQFRDLHPKSAEIIERFIKLRTTMLYEV